MMWVRGWVRRAQGLVEIESERGSGTTVDIRFQIDPQAIDRTPREATAVKAPTRALIVEDIPTWVYTSTGRPPGQAPRRSSHAIR